MDFSAFCARLSIPTLHQYQGRNIWEGRRSYQSFCALFLVAIHSCYILDWTKGKVSMRRNLIIAMCLFSMGVITHAQTSTPDLNSAEKPRVFITDSQSWEMEAAAGGSAGSFGGASRGGARSQTAEIIKTFGEKCPSVTVNNMREKAAYIVVLDHEGGKGALRHKNKVAVFDAQSGDSIVSKSTLSLGGSVEEACRGIEKHWAAHKPETAFVVDSAAKLESGAKLQPAVATIPT